VLVSTAYLYPTLLKNMAQSFQLKNFQASWQDLIRPMLLLSLGLHALVLLIPLPSSQTPEPEVEEETISLTQLPPRTQVAETPAASPSPSPAPFPSPPAPAVVASPPIIPPTTPPIQTSPQVRESAPQSAVVASPSDIPNDTLTSAEPATSDSFTADFPRYPNAQSGSFGLPQEFDPFSFRTPDPLTTVSQWFQEQLQARQFLAQPLEEASETGRSVFQVSREGATKYLTLIPNAEGEGTSYVVSDQPLPADLGSRRVISVEEQRFYEDLATVIPSADPNSGWQEVDNPNKLANPNAFYENLAEIDLNQGDIPQRRAGIERAILGVGQSDPQAVLARIENFLQIAYYEVSPRGSYGGGQLYEISRDGITAYINLVPTSDGTSTAIFLWSRSPN
jgi:hypothetical protein